MLRQKWVVPQWFSTTIQYVRNGKVPRGHTQFNTNLCEVTVSLENIYWHKPKDETYCSWAHLSFKSLQISSFSQFRIRTVLVTGSQKSVLPQKGLIHQWIYCWMVRAIPFEKLFAGRVCACIPLKKAAEWFEQNSNIAVVFLWYQCKDSAPKWKNHCDCGVAWKVQDRHP